MTKCTGELDDIRHHINRVLDSMPTGLVQERTRAHLVWELKEMLAHIQPEDLRCSELLALIAVLHPVHARVLAPPVGPPVLRVIPTTEQPAQLGESVS